MKSDPKGGQRITGWSILVRPVWVFSPSLFDSVPRFLPVPVYLLHILLHSLMGGASPRENFTSIKLDPSRGRRSFLENVPVCKRRPFEERYFTFCVLPSPPFVWILFARSDSAPQDCHQKKRENACTHRLQKRKYTGMVVHHDERIRPRRRVNCPGHDHKNHSQYHRRNGNPKPITKNLITEDTNHSTPQVTPEQCAGLCRLGICQCKKKDRRTSQGKKKKRGSTIAYDPKSKSDRYRRANG